MVGIIANSTSGGSTSSSISIFAKIEFQIRRKDTPFIIFYCHDDVVWGSFVVITVGVIIGGCIMIIIDGVVINGAVQMLLLLL